MTPPPLVDMSNFQVRREGKILLDIQSLSLQPGEVLALLGPNGAGKSTLLMGLSGILTDHSGELRCRGEIIASSSSRLRYRRRMAAVFQEPLLFDTTVFNNVAAGLRIRRWPRHDVEARVSASLDRLKIGHLRDRSARTLSGGEAQRTSLARALATEPELLLLDEPFASLDPPTQDGLMEDLERALRETRMATVLATHDRYEALRLSNRIIFLHQGRVLQEGPSLEVMNRPIDEFVASFLGAETLLRGKVVSAEKGSFTASVSGDLVQAIGTPHPGEEVVLCIRPEHVTLCTDLSQARTSARNVFVCRIDRIIPMGPVQKVFLSCHFPLAAIVTNLSVGDLPLREASQVVASFKATAVHVIHPIR